MENCEIWYLTDDEHLSSFYVFNLPLLAAEYLNDVVLIDDTSYTIFCGRRLSRLIIENEITDRNHIQISSIEEFFSESKIIYCTILIYQPDPLQINWMFLLRK